MKFLVEKNDLTKEKTETLKVEVSYDFVLFCNMHITAQT